MRHFRATVTVSENQGILATAAYDYTIKIWNLADTKAETHSLEGHEDQVIVADVQHNSSDRFTIDMTTETACWILLILNISDS